MASFTNINFNSDSDSDDDDFVPTEKDLLAGSGDEEGGAAGRSQKGQKKKKSEKKKPGGIRLDDEEEEELARQREAEEEAARRQEFLKEKEEQEEAAKSKKKDDLWADFLKDTSTAPAAAPKAPESKSQSSSGGLGSFGGSASKTKAPTPKNTTSVPKKKSTDSIMSSIFDEFEKKESKTDETSEKPADAPTKTYGDSSQPVSIVSSIFSSVEKKKSAEKTDVTETKDDAKSEEGKITITKVYDFAGESVEVSKVVDADSKEGQKFLKEKDEPMKRPATSSGGLSNLVNAINKKPKMGCLDKSKMDWDQYVEKQGIKEELETFNKGKDGYVEKQMFLERADLRRFEQEKAAREKTRTPLNR